MEASSHVKEPEAEGITQSPTHPRAKEAPTDSLKLRLALEPIGLGHAVQLALILSIGLGVLRLLRVAQGDSQLAVSLLVESGYIAPVASIFIVMFPGALLVILLYSVDYQGVLSEARWATGRNASHGATWLPLVQIWLGLLLSFLVPWWVFGTGVILVVAYGLITRRRAKRARSTATKVPVDEYVRMGRVRILTWFTAGIVPLALMLSTSTDAWKTPEVVTMKDGSQHHGMVLRRADEWLVILVEKPRYIEYLTVGDVVRREMCRPEGDERTIYDLIARARNPVGGRECRRERT
jgi:hypothetical protein